jgi:tRNA (guanine37-N1)-methyltransferase
MGMRIDILTLFPEVISAFCQASIVARAVRKGLVQIVATNLRDFATDAYGSVDDAPYGGGAGMVLMCQPGFDAVEAVRPAHSERGKVVLLTPQGRPFDQATAEAMAGEERLILLAGHYEGFDERIRTSLADVEVSLGDFVLSGGEVAAMAVIDAVVRLRPGALGEEASLHEESFQGGLLEYPQYTRPREFRGMTVPEALLSGDHRRITAWRTQQAQLRTMQRRPDLWNRYAQDVPRAANPPDTPANGRGR